MSDGAQIYERLIQWMELEEIRERLSIILERWRQSDPDLNEMYRAMTDERLSQDLPRPEPNDDFPF